MDRTTNTNQRAQPTSQDTINTTIPTSTTSTSSTLPTISHIEIKPTLSEAIDKTNHAAKILQDPEISIHAHNTMEEYSVKHTPVPQTPEEFFKKHGIDQSRQKDDLTAAESKMEEYERDVSNLTIKKIALAALSITALALLIGGAAALSFLIPPIGGAVSAGLVIGLTMGLMYGSTALACAIVTGAILLDPDDPEYPKENRGQLKKNLDNTNTAFDLFKKYPKNPEKPDELSYEGFMDTMPALTKDGVRSFELDQLDQYNMLFIKKLKLQKLKDRTKIDEEVSKTADKLRDLGVEDPFDKASIQNRIDELMVGFESPIEVSSDSDVEIEMETINPNQKTIDSIVEISKNLSQLRQQLEEADRIFEQNRIASLETELKTGREKLEEAVAGKQKSINQGQPDREIQTLNKEFVAAKEDYNKLLRSSHIPENKLEETIKKKEHSLQQTTDKIQELEEKVKAHDEVINKKQIEEDTLEIASLKTAQTKITDEISKLNTILASKKKYEEIESKIAAAENKKQIQELKDKSDQFDAKLEEIKGKVETTDKYTHSRISFLKNEIETVKENVNKAKIDTANTELKKLESALTILTEEADYRSQVNTRYAQFKDKHSKLSPEAKESRLKEAAWKNSEEQKYYETERQRIDNLIKEEKKKLEESHYSELQGALHRNFTELSKLQQLRNIVFMANSRHIKELKG